jgi:outer membrane lipoprotein SlyB
MDTSPRTAATPALHPALWVAAISVTIFSAVGIASLTGAFERKPTVETPPVAVAAAVVPAPVPEAPPAQLAASEPVTTPAPAPEAQAKKKVAVAKHAVAPVTKAVHAAAPAAPRAVRVADQSHDSGIDVTPAYPQYDAHTPPQPYASPDADTRFTAPVCANCGVIESVRAVQAAAKPSGLGAAAGGVVGGLLGNNVGKGGGRTVATLIGIAGGAFAGHQIEKTQRSVTQYEVNVLMDSGERRTVTLDAEPTWRAGDKVRLQDGNLAWAG